MVWEEVADNTVGKAIETVCPGAKANNVELAYTPYYWIVAQPDRGPIHRLRYFALDGTDHPSHQEQARMIRRYIAWRNRHAHDQRYAPS